MPRNRGTSRKGKPKKNERSAGMGRALERAQQKLHQQPKNTSHAGGMAASGIRTSNFADDEEGTKIKSVLEMDDLTDFLGQAEMAGREFASERERFVVLDSTSTFYNPTAPRVHFSESNHPKFHYRELSLPRRPSWDDRTSREQLHKSEQDAFLEWRRGIALEEEKVFHSSTAVTPFEKNLEVWRQLWRVLEKSDVVIQIADGRNPLFYLSEDLRTYTTKELGKEMIIVINKSDYLTVKQRSMWHDYFQSLQLKHYFFSAYEEQKKLDECPAEANIGGEDTDAETKKCDQANGEAIDETNKKDDGEIMKDDDIGIQSPLTRTQLLSHLHTLSPPSQPITIGTVGFPNVGKSSLINVLLGVSKTNHSAHRVGVASQPGKTKHFQTLKLTPTITLCDCPGLVFPSLVSSRADLIAAGVFPIQQMRDNDYREVMELMVRRIPLEILEAVYGISVSGRRGLKEETLVDVVLTSYCEIRSMYNSSSGVPDHQRAARVMIKDFVEGKLLYCHAPPEVGQEEEGEWKQETILTNAKKTKKLGDTLFQKERSGGGDNNKEETLRDQDDDKTDEIRRKEEEDLIDLSMVEDDLHLLDVAGLNPKTEDKTKSTIEGKRDKKHKWKRKAKKDRDPDPYGCHPELNGVSSYDAGKSGGIIVNAGKHGHVGYTRPNYTGAKAAVSFEGKQR